MRQSIVITAILWLAVGLLFCSHAHAQSITPSRGITGATTGGGLVVTSNKLGMLASCASGEVMGWNGTAWACTPNGTGDVTSVVAGDGLSGGGTSGALTLDVGAGTGITVGPNAISVNTTTIQARVTGTCSAGSSIRVIDAAGTVTCEADTDTTYSAGAGLTLMTGVFAIDPDYTQRRVSDTCAAGTSIREIAEDGTVTCETDDTGITNSAGANVLTKSDGTNLVASSWTDNGTTSTTTGNLDVDGNLSKFGSTDGAFYVVGNTINAGYATDTDTHSLALNFTGFAGSTTRFRDVTFYDGKSALGCTLTGSTKILNCVGGLQVNGTAVNTFTTANAIPKGNGTGLTASSWTDDGTTSTSTTNAHIALDTGSLSRVLNVGRSTALTTNAQSGLRFTAGADGNLYFDHKVYTSGTINYRYGAGAVTGGNGTWFSLATGTGTTTFTGNLSTAANLTAGDDVATDSHTVNGNVTHSGRAGNIYQINNTATGQVADVNAFRFAGAGTFDATAADRNNRGLTAVAAGTRSAGAFNVINTGVYSDAVSGQLNYSFFGNRGTLHNRDDTQLGDASTDRVGIGIAPDSNHAMTFAAAVGNKIALYPISSTAAFGFGVQGGQLQYYVTDSTNRHSFGYGDSDAFTEAFRIDADGQLWGGDTANSAVSNNLDVATFGNTGTGQTADTDIIDVTNSGTFDVGAGNLTAIGLRSTLTLDGTNDGTNTLTAIAGRFESVSSARFQYGVYAVADGPGGSGGCSGCTVTSGPSIAYGIYASAQADIAYSGYFDEGVFSVSSNASTAVFEPSAFQVWSPYIQIGDHATDVIEFSNGPSGINNYDGTHLEFVEEWLSRLWVTNSTQSIYYINISSGAITAEAGASGRPGIIEFSTSTSATGAVLATTSFSAIDFNAHTSTSFKWVGAFPVLSVVAQEYNALAGFYDTNSVDQVDGCYFLYDRAGTATDPGTGDATGTPGDKWQIWCAANSVRTGYILDGTATEDSFTGVDSDVVGGTYYELEVVVEADDKARFYIDDVEVGRITTNIPSGSSRMEGAGFFMRKSAGTTARLMDTDHTRLSIDLPTAR